jgi:hypothetical protein
MLLGDRHQCYWVIGIDENMQLGHISNGGAGELNPGSELLVLSYSTLF